VGASGAQGVQGPQGASGATGLTGPTGPAGPATFKGCHVYRNAAFNFGASGAWTLIPFDSKLTDANNWYDAVTTHRFTPNIAGYYFLKAQIAGSIDSGNTCGVAIMKNGPPNTGVNICNGFEAPQPSGTFAAALPQAMGVFFLNGTTDYLEIYGYTAPSNLGMSLPTAAADRPGLNHFIAQLVG
jgi:hypothetical protein